MTRHHHHREEKHEIRKRIEQAAAHAVDLRGDRAEHGVGQAQPHRHPGADHEHCRVEPEGQALGARFLPTGPGDRGEECEGIEAEADEIDRGQPRPCQRDQRGHEPGDVAQEVANTGEAEIAPGLCVLRRLRGPRREEAGDRGREVAREKQGNLDTLGARRERDHAGQKRGEDKEQGQLAEQERPEHRLHRPRSRDERERGRIRKRRGHRAGGAASLRSARGRCSS
jgi:hypothetical protein